MKVYRRVLRWFDLMERIDEGPRQRKVKAAIVEGQQRRGISRFGWLDGDKNGFSCQGSKLAGGNATHKRKECAERTCEGMMVLMQFEEDRCLHVVCHLY